MRRLALLLVLLALLGVLAGCGGDEDESGDSGGADTAAETQAAPETEAAPADDPGGEDEIEETITVWLTEGGCERMTTKFLEDQTLGVGGDTREAQCEYFEETFQEPQYSADDIVVSDVRIDGEKATAKVGDNISNVESKYNLVVEEGQWRIDSVDL